MRSFFLVLLACLTVFAQSTDKYKISRQDFCTGGGLVENSEHSLFYSLGVGNFGHMKNAYFYIGPATKIVHMAEAVNPVLFKLHQNFPNPFNSSTTFQYDVPSVSQIKIEVYSVLGQRIALLYSGRQAAGQYRLVYGGLDEQQVPLPSGLYFCKMTADGFVQTIKFVIMR
ncbi:T9SS type A sorting domain-containing protein [candidate division KSB1 bacterium]|nr:T9SS type A sorting domain-containing protein [candidate division KSB1 bacterium]